MHLTYPIQVPPPFTIMVEDIDDPVAGYHQHIDMIYFCRLVGAPASVNHGWSWVTRKNLANGTPLPSEGIPSVPPPDDMRLLGLRALEVVGAVTS